MKCHHANIFCDETEMNQADNGFLAKKNLSVMSCVHWPSLWVKTSAMSQYDVTPLLALHKVAKASKAFGFEPRKPRQFFQQTLPIYMNFKCKNWLFLNLLTVNGNLEILCFLLRII
jgi:hypothetical protein